MTTHLSWESINDYADGVMEPEGARNDAARHLDTCAECRAQLESLREFLRDANGATSEVAPPDEVWPALRAELENRKVIDLPGVFGRGYDRNAARRRTWWILSAAAVALIAVSSSVTAVLMRGGNVVTVARDASAPAAPASVVSMQEVAQVEKGYLDSVVELTAALEAARPHLSQATIAIIERNLGVIDAAIAESKAAMFRDPGNRVLLEVLSGTYRQKLDLLRRAAQLASS